MEKEYKKNLNMFNLICVFPSIPPAAMDLLDKMLVLDPAERISAEDALKSDWLINISPDVLVPPE